MRAGISKIAVAVLSRVAKFRIGRYPCIKISTSAKVDYSRIRGAEKFGGLTIGDDSIVEASVICDREGGVVSIGARTFIGSSKIICASNITIGDDVLMSWGCHVVDHDSHSLRWEHRSEDVKNWRHGKKIWDHVASRPVVVGNRSWIGFNCSILKGVTIGEGAVVGACSVVVRDVPPFSLVVGNPARTVRTLSGND